MCYGQLGHLFPYLQNEPSCHKRLKKAAPVLAAAIGHLASQSPSWYDTVRLIDATPVPCGASPRDRSPSPSRPAGCTTGTAPLIRADAEG